MILRNGTIRTLDPSLPTVAALWIAGDRIAGGVGVHETALPSPETVDLGGRCVLPGFTDSHVHFPTWAVAQHDVSLHGCASLAEALDRVARSRATGTWLRGQGWRDADWPDGPPTAAASTSRLRPAGDADLEGLPRALAQLGGARARGRRPRGRGRSRRPRRRAASRPASSTRSPRGGSRRATSQTPDDEYLAAMRDGVKLAASRGVTCLHDKDGWLGAIGLWQQLEAQGGAAAPRLAVDAGRARSRRCASSACAAAPALPSSGSAT